jgi:hypothetical protein
VYAGEFLLPESVQRMINRNQYFFLKILTWFLHVKNLRSVIRMCWSQVRMSCQISIGRFKSLETTIFDQIVEIFSDRKMSTYIHFPWPTYTKLIFHLKIRRRMFGLENSRKIGPIFNADISLELYLLFLLLGKYSMAVWLQGINAHMAALHHAWYYFDLSVLSEERKKTSWVQYWVQPRGMPASGDHGWGTPVVTKFSRYFNSHIRFANYDSRNNDFFRENFISRNCERKVFVTAPQVERRCPGADTDSLHSSGRALGNF